MRLFTALQILSHPHLHHARKDEATRALVLQLQLQVTRRLAGFGRQFYVAESNRLEVVADAWLRLNSQFQRGRFTIIDTILADPLFEGSPLREPGALPQSEVPRSEAEAAQLDRLERGLVGFVQKVLFSAACDLFGTYHDDHEVNVDDRANDGHFIDQASEGLYSGTGDDRAEAKRATERARALLDAVWASARTRYKKPSDADALYYDLLRITDEETLSFHALLARDLVETSSGARERLESLRARYAQAASVAREGVDPEFQEWLDLVLDRFDGKALAEWVAVRRLRPAPLHVLRDPAIAACGELAELARALEADVLRQNDAKTRRARVDQQAKRLRERILEAATELAAARSISQEEHQLLRKSVEVLLYAHAPTQPPPAT